MSLITPPQRSQSQLRAIRLVPSEDRLLDGGGGLQPARHLNLRLPHGSAHQVEALERWTDDQLKGVASSTGTACLSSCNPAARPSTMRFRAEIPCAAPAIKGPWCMACPDWWPNRNSVTATASDPCWS